jgi:hypothetical protein
MSECVDYRRHERQWCHHRAKAMRWHAEDGCVGVDCAECWKIRQGFGWTDIVKEEPVCAEGMALRVDDRTFADAMGFLLVSQKRFEEIEQERKPLESEEALRKWPIR